MARLPASAFEDAARKVARKVLEFPGAQTKLGHVLLDDDVAAAVARPGEDFADASTEERALGGEAFAGLELLDQRGGAAGRFAEAEEPELFQL